MAKITSKTKETKKITKEKKIAKAPKKEQKKFYVTTPIYYVNNSPHIGSAYTTIAADILARWHRLCGEDVFFLTGTDEHGQKIQEMALAAGKKPQEFVDEVAQKFKDTFKLLNISNDYFIRTTDKDHEKDVQRILQELYDKKLIYKGEYEACYCVGCEQYLNKSDLVEGKCPLHKKEPEIIKEESYMFKLSSFEDKLLKAIKNEDFRILPVKKRNEMISFIEGGLQDVSFSRKKSKVAWGIELPFDKNHTCYVWVDAFWNYITGLKAKGVFEKYWPVDLQLMANDILRVHSTIWPALLLATNNPLPKTMFIHGYFTVDGQKMSKSLGNAIDPNIMAKKYGVDSLRYFLIRNISFGQDGDFSEKTLVERHNSELADKFGNLVSRTTALVEKYGLKKTKNSIFKELKLKEIEKELENFEIDKALNNIFSFVDRTNEYIQSKKPWETQDKGVLYEVIDSIKVASILLWPFIPQTCEKIANQLGFEIKYENIEKNLEYSNIKKSEILFKKIEFVENNVEEKVAEKVNKPTLAKENKVEGIMNMAEMITYNDFAKLDLRVGTIKKVEDVEGADKLLKLSVNTGEEKERTILAGIKLYYSKQELLGKQIIVICNLEPRKMKGIESQGMLLAASSEDHSKVILLSPEKKTGEGWKVG